MSHVRHGDESIARTFFAQQGVRSPQVKIPGAIARGLLTLHASESFGSLTRSTKDVLAYLVRLADLHDGCAPIFAFKRTIASKTDLSESSVYRALNELVKENIITREPQGRKARNGRLSGAYVRLTPAICVSLGLPTSPVVKSETPSSSDTGGPDLAIPMTDGGGEGDQTPKTRSPSSKMTDGQCITGFKALKAFQSLQKHSPRPQHAKASGQNSPRTSVPEELRWLISEKELRPSQIFLLMGEFSRGKRRLSDAVACTETRLKALSPREIFAYLRALSKAPTDFAWIARQKAQAVKETTEIQRVKASRETLLAELDGKFLVNDTGAIHRVEVQVQSAEVWWREATSGRVRTGYIPINDGFVKAILDGRLTRIDSARALATIENGFADHVVH